MEEYLFCRAKLSPNDDQYIFHKRYNVFRSWTDVTFHNKYRVLLKAIEMVTPSSVIMGGKYNGLYEQ